MYGVACVTWYLVFYVWCCMCDMVSCFCVLRCRLTWYLVFMYCVVGVTWYLVFVYGVVGVTWYLVFYEWCCRCDMVSCFLCMVL